MNHLSEDWGVEYRKEFPVTDKLAYMNHAGVAPTSRRVCQAVAHSLEALANYGALFDVWEQQTERCRQRFASLIGCLPHEVAFVRNTSHGLGLVAEGLGSTWRTGDRIAVAKRIEYPSNVQVWEHVGKSRGIPVDMIPEVDGSVTVEAVANLLRSKNTKLVAVSSAQFSTGALTDLMALGEFCRDHDVLLCVDGIQTIGALPIDVKKMGIHFLAADSHKWMLGMMGVGALYVDERLAPDMRPALVGWKSMADGWNFGSRDYNLLPHAGRFEEGSPTYAMIEGFSAALELLQEVSVDAISRRIRVLVDRLVARLEELGCEVGPHAEHRHHIVTFEFPGTVASEFVEELKRKQIVVTAREGRVRVSPHFYNTEEEIDKLLGAVEEIIHQKHRGRKSHA